MAPSRLAVFILSLLPGNPLSLAATVSEYYRAKRPTPGSYETPMTAETVQPGYESA